MSVIGKYLILELILIILINIIIILEVLSNIWFLFVSFWVLVQWKASIYQVLIFVYYAKIIYSVFWVNFSKLNLGTLRKKSSTLQWSNFASLWTVDCTNNFNPQGLVNSHFMIWRNSNIVEMSLTSESFESVAMFLKNRFCVHYLWLEKC